MPKNNKVSNQSVSRRNRKAANYGLQKSDVFQLIEQIPKEIPYCSLFATYQNNLDFTENCLAFLEYIKPECLEDLRFDPDKHDVFSVQHTLLTKILNLGYTVELDADREDRGGYLTVLYDVPFESHTWFILEGKYIEALPEELKIAYAKLLHNFNSAFCSDDCGFSILEGDLSSYHNSEFSRHGEYLLSHLYEDEEGELGYDDEVTKKIEERFEKEHLVFYREKVELLKKYSEMDINISKNFKTEDPVLIKIKECLIKGLNYNFSVWNRFSNDCDWMEDCSVPYEGSVMLMWDMDKGAEAAMFMIANETSQNGGANPMGWYITQDGKVQPGPDEQEIKHFKEVQDYLCEAATLLCDYYEKVFA